jgi:hypothetical protein
MRELKFQAVIAGCSTKVSCLSCCPAVCCSLDCSYYDRCCSRLAHSRLMLTLSHPEPPAMHKIIQATSYTYKSTVHQLQSSHSVSAEGNIGCPAAHTALPSWDTLPLSTTTAKLSVLAGVLPHCVQGQQRHSAVSHRSQQG